MNTEIIDGIVYAEVENVDDIPLVVEIIKKMSEEDKCRFEYLIKVDKPQVKYFYKGIRAVSIRLFYTCGGSMSLDRYEWQSCDNSQENVERVKTVAFGNGLSYVNEKPFPI